MTPLPEDKPETGLAETPRPAKERLTPVIFADEPYAEFNHHMDAELARLIARWQHLAAPNATLTDSQSRHGSRR